MKNLEDIIDFANLVFNLKGEGTDFAELLPKAYSHDRAERLKHHIIEENGKIRALIDLYPLELRQSDCMLKAAYVGTVSVHPNSRHKGYMTELMKQVEESARAAQCDLMILDGGRHRYRYYGFERAGIKYNYNITRDSIRHCCQSLYGDDFGAETFYSFEIMDRQTEDADDIIDRLYALYSRRHVTARSREDFLPCLQSWSSIIYLVYRNENLVGYINASFDERNIFEFELDDISMLPEIIYEFIDNIDCDETGITVGADETEKTGFLDKMCDYYNVGMSHQIKILNYRNVLEFLFKWKSKYRRLEQGECTIVINETGTGYQVTVSDAGDAQEIKVETACTVPDIIVENSSELVYLLTTPLCFQEQQNPQGKLKNTPSGWFPLPFFLPEADAF